ncbi:MAG: DUF4249 domain-containing protein, partial [Flavobacteriales bacterium]|nr:DUF4249 domain-containing protein [Flavobacteriales bacterium]
MKRFTILLCAFLCLASCEDSLNVKIPIESSKLSVTSYLQADDYFDGQNSSVYVSNSISAFASTDDYVYTVWNPVINNATVSIYETNPFQEDVAAYLLEFDYDCYCYINTELSPKENTTYRLEVEADGYPSVSAIDKVPFNPSYEITNFELLGYMDNKSYEGELSQFNLVLNDDPNAQNFYQLKILIVNTSNFKVRSCYYSVSDPSFLNSLNNTHVSGVSYTGRNGYFTDELFNGTSKKFFIQHDKPKGIYDHFYIELRALSKDLYEFNETKKEQNRDSNNPLFVSEPIFLDSNVENGYGIFGGKSASNKAY